MKKLIAIMLVAVLALSMVACGGSASSTPASEAVSNVAEAGASVGVCIYKFDDNFMTLYRNALEADLKAMRPDESIPAWCFRFLQDLPNVGMILSGMSNLSQMEDNLKTFSSAAPLSGEEADLLQKIAEKLKNAIPCTACRYCCDGCPMGLDIPLLLSIYNDLRYEASAIASMRVEALPAEKQPSACVGCGQCSAICPQNIDIPAALSDLTARLSSLPSWESICRARAAAQSD